MVVKNGKRLCGSGGAITNVPIIQNKAYFEVKIQSNGLNFPPFEYTLLLKDL